MTNNIFQEVKYKDTSAIPLMSDDCPRPKERKPVLVLVDGYSMPFVAYMRIWSDGAWWVIPGGTPDKGFFIVTHWCDCLPDRVEYADLINHSK